MPPSELFTRRLICMTRFALLIGMAAFLTLAAVGCARQVLRVPPLTPEPTARHLTGKFVWFDLFTRDLSQACRFYEDLMGWSFHEMSGVENRVMTIELDGVPIGNAVAVDPARIQDKPSRWLSYMSVPDVDQTILRIEQHEGSVFMPARDLPDRGRVAVVRDPEGASFALVASTAGDPPDHGFDRNDFFAAELWAQDRDAAIIFYRAIVGYDLELRELWNGKPYHLLVVSGVPRAGVVQIPWASIQPNWVPYIAVEDVDAVARRAVSLGGRLLIEPDPNVREGNVAIIADPTGAVFAVQQR